MNDVKIWGANDQIISCFKYHPMLEEVTFLFRWLYIFKNVWNSHSKLVLQFPHHFCTYYFGHSISRWHFSKHIYRFMSIRLCIFFLNALDGLESMTSTFIFFLKLQTNLKCSTAELKCYNLDVVNLSLRNGKRKFFFVCFFYKKGKWLHLFFYEAPTPLYLTCVCTLTTHFTCCWIYFLYLDIFLDGYISHV